MMDFLKNYGGMIIGGLLALGAFMLSGGGIIGILLASLIGAGAFMFGGNLMEQLTQTAQPVMEKFGLAEHKPLKRLPIRVEKELGSGDEKNHAIVNIDGRDYDIMVTYENKKVEGKPTKLSVVEIKYKPVNSEEYKNLDIGSRKIEVGEISAGQLKINPEKAEEIYRKVSDEVVIQGRAAVKELQLDLYDLQKSGQLLAHSKAKQKSYIVKLTENGFELLDLQGNAVKDAKGAAISISGIDKEALKDGMLAREVAKAIQLVNNDSGTKTVNDKLEVVQNKNDIKLIGLNQETREEPLTEGTFKVDNKEAEFKVIDGKLIVTRNGRDLDPVALRENIIEKATADKTGNNIFYSTNIEGLRNTLKKIIDEDDKKVKDYYKITTKISDSEYLLHSKDGAFLITTDKKKNSYTIKNLNETDKGEASVESGGLSEAFHYLQEARISPQAPDRSADLSRLAANHTGQRFPAQEADRGINNNPTYVETTLPKVAEQGQLQA